MTEITKKSLVLSFGTEDGQNLKVTVNEPKEQLSAEMVSSAMDAIIASQALGTTSPVRVKTEAKYVIQQVEKVTLA